MTEPPEEPTPEQVRALVDACPQAALSAEEVRIVVVQCVCGKLKQQGFICDFCYSTEDTSPARTDGKVIATDSDGTVEVP